MLRLGIDSEKPYRATFICQDCLCRCNMALISFRLFRKNLSKLRDFFGQMVYRPPWQKISRTPMLKYERFVQVSGLCGPQFLSYLPKRFMHLCTALYGDAILKYRFGPPIWPPEINKNIMIWSSLFLQKLFLFTRELAYVPINISFKT